MPLFKSKAPITIVLPEKEEHKVFLAAKFVKHILKNLNKDDIESTYASFNTDEYSEFRFTHEFVENINGRKIIKVTSINDISLDIPIYFYKSTGESRSGCELKDYWLPIGEFENIKDYKSYNFENVIIRIKKAEDIYLTAPHNYLCDLIKDEFYNPETFENVRLCKYSRFINKRNAFISRKLKEMCI
jgi:hypothetical protein